MSRLTSGHTTGRGRYENRTIVKSETNVSELERAQVNKGGGTPALQCIPCIPCIPVSHRFGTRTESARQMAHHRAPQGTQRHPQGAQPDPCRLASGVHHRASKVRFCKGISRKYDLLIGSTNPLKRSTLLIVS